MAALRALELTGLGVSCLAEQLCGRLLPRKLVSHSRLGLLELLACTRPPPLLPNAQTIHRPRPNGHEDEAEAHADADARRRSGGKSPGARRGSRSSSTRARANSSGGAPGAGAGAGGRCRNTTCARSSRRLQARMVSTLLSNVYLPTYLPTLGRQTGDRGTGLDVPEYLRYQPPRPKADPRTPGWPCTESPWSSSRTPGSRR